MSYIVNRVTVRGDDLPFSSALRQHGLASHPVRSWAQGRRHSLDMGVSAKHAVDSTSDPVWTGLPSSIRPESGRASDAAH
jgi:hypothetical protein